MSNSNKVKMESWAKDLLVHPISKKDIDLNDFKYVKSIYDLRVFLRNTHGFSQWLDGQNEYEKWYANGGGYSKGRQQYLEEIIYDREIYEKFPIDGTVLDVGGGVGTTREFLSDDVRYIACDPFIQIFEVIDKNKLEAYKCLSKEVNFVSAMAEFLPFKDNSFDWVHMRSMLDHVQVPDLAIIEARRVLKENGSLLVGLYVEGGVDGSMGLIEYAKHELKEFLAKLGISRFKDHHTWHPSFFNLRKIITDNGFIISDVFWQSYWKGKVVYIKASKT